MEQYSVVLLKEGKIRKPSIVGDKVFEESIILCTLPESFFDDTSYHDILSYFMNNIPAEEYENAYGEVISNEVIAVIDRFYIQSNIIFDEFSEVYSRHFLEKNTMELDDIIKKYYFVFAFGDE